MNYILYALSNASNILACILPDPNGIGGDSNSFPAEKYVKSGADAVGWGYKVGTCSEVFNQSTMLCKADNSFGGGYFSQGILDFNESVSASTLGHFVDALCNAEQVDDAHSSEKMFGIILGVSLLGTAMAMLLVTRLESGKSCSIPTISTSGFFKKTISAEEDKPLVQQGVVNNPVYDPALVA